MDEPALWTAYLCNFHLLSVVLQQWSQPYGHQGVALAGLHAKLVVLRVVFSSPGFVFGFSPAFPRSTTTPATTITAAATLGNLRCRSPRSRPALVCLPAPCSRPPGETAVIAVRSYGEPGYKVGRSPPPAALSLAHLSPSDGLLPRLRWPPGVEGVLIFSNGPAPGRAKARAVATPTLEGAQAFWLRRPVGLAASSGASTRAFDGHTSNVSAQSS